MLDLPLIIYYTLLLLIVHIKDSNKFHYVSLSTSYFSALSDFLARPRDRLVQILRIDSQWTATLVLLCEIFLTQNP